MQQDLYRIISSGTIYVSLFGQYWPVADAATAARLFGLNPQLTNVSVLPGNATLGPSIARGSCLWQPAGSAEIYFLCAGNNTAYWISSPAALHFYQFNGPVQQEDNHVLGDWLGRLVKYGRSIDMPSARDRRRDGRVTAQPPPPSTADLFALGTPTAAG
jgi:hypothetical protein